MKRTPIALIVVAALAGLALLLWPDTRVKGDKPLVCFVGGTMTPVFNALAEAYAKAGGSPVEITSADSGELLASIENKVAGDLYVAHDPFMDIAMQRGLGVNAWSIAEIYPVLIVRTGYTKVRSLRDLEKPDVRVYLTDYEHSTLGWTLPTIFSRAGMDFAEFNKRKKVTTHRSGSWVRNQVLMEQADAALVWQAVAHLRRDDLDIIPIDAALPRPGVDALTSATGKRYYLAPVKVDIVTLISSKRQHDSEMFVEFVISDAGKAILADFGFKIGPTSGKRQYINGARVIEPVPGAPAGPASSSAPATAAEAN